MLVVVSIEFVFKLSTIKLYQTINIYTLMKMCACVDALQVIIYHFFAFVMTELRGNARRNVTCAATFTSHSQGSHSSNLF